MNVQVYALAIATFTVSLVELIIGGILPLIAADLNVSVSMAGQLITIFAIVFAISSPVLLVATAKMERKRLYVIALFIFLCGCLIAFWSPNYTVLFISRIVTAISGGLLTALSLTMAVAIVSKKYRARVIGVILMGISSAIVLGVPIGVFISDLIGWRMIFLLIAFITLAVIVLIALTLERVQRENIAPLRVQFASLRNVKIISAQLVTALAMAGHYTFYAYFAPFLQQMLQLEANGISIAYFVYGLAAVCGGMIGGTLADFFGTKISILSVVSAFAAVLFLLPPSTIHIVFFTIALITWGIASWALSAPQQSYLIEIAPNIADIQQSMNLSFLHGGIALGSAVGGLVYDYFSSFYILASVGGMLVILALCSAIFSLAQKGPSHI